MGKIKILLKKILPVAVQEIIVILINITVITKVNIRNKLALGRNAPEYGERLWINPSFIKEKIPVDTRKEYFNNVHVPKGAVIDGDWDKQGVQIELTSVFLSCRNHYINGVPWERTGRYELMLKEIKQKGAPVSGCANLDDIVARYKKLDKIYEKIRAEKIFRTSEENSGRKGIFLFLKKETDVIVCIDRHGMPMLAGDGHHRISIAKLLELPVIPAMLGVVHPLGLKYLDLYRNPPYDKEREDNREPLENQTL
jgi:hypothetical protein